ncbi:exonuclease [Nitzschia inconspicua]|uniref:Exonuclease n=1 Tax=Nitzschia inconspicua TaxID=303405 RepID=A0A9K3PPV0_9STRA|nr:exonuclease [Nitzschia inconspicua]
MMMAMLPSTPAHVEVFGVPRVVATEQQQHKKRRRRRRRNNSNKTASPNIYCDRKSSNGDGHGDDSSTCATISSDSTTSTSSHQRLDSMIPPTRKSNTKTNNKNNNDASNISLEEQARYVALDCEMVGVGYGGRRSSVARVTLVSWDGTILLDEMVRQEEEVTDYRTFVSGITAMDLESSSTYTQSEIRALVQDMLQDKILVGHALKNDLRALGITHPWYLTRDTAKFEPFMQVRFDDGVLWPKKLSELVKTRLHRDIQQPGVPHSSYEDAVAAMDLYKLVRRKWEKAMEYKMTKTREIVQTTSKSTVVVGEQLQHV